MRPGLRKPGKHTARRDGGQAAIVASSSLLAGRFSFIITVTLQGWWGFYPQPDTLIVIRSLSFEDPMQRIRLSAVFAAIVLFTPWLIGENPKPADTTAAPAEALDKQILAEAKSASEIMANLGYLTDIIGPRLTVAASLKRANDWTAERMKAYGLENVHLEPWEIPVGWERGTATAPMLEPQPGRPITIASSGWTPGTKGKIAGDRVICQARRRDDLAQYKGKLKNAIILRGEPRK